jgi:hypothetical protein
MSDPGSADRESRPDENERASDAGVRDLIKRSLSVEALAQEPPHLLAGVQRRIRKRSRGKFFADGWSTSQSRASYVLAGLITLMLAALAYFALGPWDVR